MSHFECCLNRRFWRSKKLYNLFKLGEGGNQVGILIFSAHTQFSSLILAGGRLTRLTRLPAWRVWYLRRASPAAWSAWPCWWFRPVWCAPVFVHLVRHAQLCFCGCPSWPWIMPLITLHDQKIEIFFMISTFKRTFGEGSQVLGVKLAAWPQPQGPYLWGRPDRSFGSSSWWQRRWRSWQRRSTSRRSRGPGTRTQDPLPWDWTQQGPKVRWGWSRWGPPSPGWRSPALLQPGRKWVLLLCGTSIMSVTCPVASIFLFWATRYCARIM